MVPAALPRMPSVYFKPFFFIWCFECNPWNWDKTQLLLLIFALSFSHLSCLGWSQSLASLYSSVIRNNENPTTKCILIVLPSWTSLSMQTDHQLSHWRNSEIARLSTITYGHLNRFCFVIWTLSAYCRAVTSALTTHVQHCLTGLCLITNLCNIVY